MIAAILFFAVIATLAAAAQITSKRGQRNAYPIAFPKPILHDTYVAGTVVYQDCCSGVGSDHAMGCKRTRAY